MYLIKRDIDNLDGAAVVALDVNAHVEAKPETAETKAPAVPETPIVETKVSGAEEEVKDEIETNDFSFELEDTSAEPTGKSGSPSTPEITVPKSQYDKVVDEFNQLKNDFTVLQGAFENPIVKAALDYQTALEVGAEVNPSVFMENYFGVDANKLDVESLIRLQVKDEASRLGQALSEDAIDSTVAKRLMKLDDMDDLERAVFEKELRDKRALSSKEKQDQLINERKADIEKGQLFWKDAYENGVKPIIDKMLSEGKKEIGLKTKVSKEDVDKIGVAIANNFYRYTKDGKLNIPHAIEVAHFSSDMSGYIRKIEEAAIQRYESQKLRAKQPDAANSAGTVLSLGKGQMTQKPATNLLDGATVLK